MGYTFRKLLFTTLFMLIYILLVSILVDLGMPAVLSLILGIPFLIIIVSGQKHIDRLRTIDVAKSRLTSALTQLLSLPSNQGASLQEFVSLFFKSICDTNAMSIGDIDTFIDWIFQSGYFVPNYSQYRALGMTVITTCKIYVPDSIRSDFPEWVSFRSRAIDSGILLTSIRTAPSIDLWNTELASYLTDLFEAGDPALLSVLERIVQLAEEGIAEDANLPEYIARIADLPHRSEHDIVREVSAKIELHLRIFAKELSIVSEPKPTDAPAKFRRMQRYAKRIDIVRDRRKQLLLSEELKE